MRHCRDDAAQLPEPEWYATLSTVGRCQDGQKLAHEFSRPYPTYSPAETQKKLEHALTAAGPTTCEYVINNLNGHQYCSKCPNLGLVTAPIVLGNPISLVTEIESAALPVSNDPWPEPKPVAPTLPPVAPFDINLLPGCFRDRVADISELMQVPPDFPAAVLMVGFSGAVGRRAQIRPKRFDYSFTVVPNLWGGIVARPGELKSPTIKQVLSPLRKLQAEELEAHKEAMKAYEQELEAWDTRKATWKKNAQKHDDGSVFDEVKPEKPPCTRYMVNDPTIAKLHEILSENPNGLLYVRDELAGWFATLDTKGRETDRPFLLEAWNGDGDFTVDRIGRGTNHVPHVCVALVGGIQPSKLQGYMRHAVGGGPEDDGLAQRLQVIVWPDPPPNWINVDREPDGRAADAVEQAFRRVVDRNSSEPVLAHFSADAQELFDAWHTELALRLRKDALKPAMQSHLAKYRKLMPALALLLHLAENDGDEVQLIHAQNAADLCTYLESHAQRVYAAPRAADEQNAASLGEKIKKGRLGVRFTARDVYQHKWSGLTTPDEAERALAILEGAGWVRAVDLQPGQKGGRRTVAYDVNPVVYRG
jgi:hypothetical protein